MKIFLAADHAGFALKDKIKAILTKQGQRVIDVTPIYKEGDDYPLAVKAFAEQFKPNQRGLLFCGSGVGACIAANRYKGIRAAVGHEAKEVKLAREHNDINVLCLSGWNFNNKNNALPLINEFLKTKKSSAGRHTRRIKQLD